MIRRETSPELVNAVANAPEVHGHIAQHSEPMDWSPAFTDERIVILSNGEDAVGVFVETAPRYFQTHTMFGATCRGAKALEVAREMIDYMIPEYADGIWGATPMSNTNARWFNRQMGAKVIGHDVSDHEGEMEVFALFGEVS